MLNTPVTAASFLFHCDSFRNPSTKERVSFTSLVKEATELTNKLSEEALIVAKDLSLHNEDRKVAFLKNLNSIIKLKLNEFNHEQNNNISELQEANNNLVSSAKKALKVFLDYFRDRIILTTATGSKLDRDTTNQLLAHAA